MTDDTRIGINPWDVEYRPNPVIFPHLAAVQEEPGPNRSQTSSPESPSLPNSASPAESSRAAQDTSSLDDPVHRLGSRNPWKQHIGQLNPSSAGPQSKSPNVHDSTKVVLQVADRQPQGSSDILSETDNAVTGGESEGVDDNSLYAMPSSSHSPIAELPENGRLCDKMILVPGAGYEHEYESVLPSVEERSSTESSHPSPLTWYSTSESNSTAPSLHAGNTTQQTSKGAHKLATPAPSLSPISVLYATMPEFPCPICNINFDTEAQRKNHHNRKHNLRFICPVDGCTSAFGLRADLERHKRTVHKAILKVEPSLVFRCTNTGCADPKKIYTRKDNFTRHVKRCKKNIERSEAARKTQSRLG